MTDAEKKAMNQKFREQAGCDMAADELAGVENLLRTLETLARTLLAARLLIAGQIETLDAIANIDPEGPAADLMRSMREGLQRLERTLAIYGDADDAGNQRGKHHHEHH
jgi:hypothetical protein